VEDLCHTLLSKCELCNLCIFSCWCTEMIKNISIT